jgi:CBS domain-containing protein
MSAEATERPRLAGVLQRWAVMARVVSEIMNAELLAVGPDTPACEIIDLLKSFGVSTAPVLGEQRRPLGVVSARDLLGPARGTALERMSKPPLCVSLSATIEDAARLLAKSDFHHLVVVDGAGAAVGILSTLDLLRHVLALPTRHPARFPHWDEATKASWSDDLPLDSEHVADVAAMPGVLTVLSFRPDSADKVLWVEPCADLRARVRALERTPREELPEAVRPIERSHLRVRVAAILDSEHLPRVLAVLRDRLAHVPPPGDT